MDRYNHELETDEDDEDDDEEFPDFSNFSTCSPRYSRICGSPGPSSPVSPKNVKKLSDGKDSSEEVATPRSNRSSESSPPTVRRRSLSERNASRRSESRESDEDFRRGRSDSDVHSNVTRRKAKTTNEYVLMHCYIVYFPIGVHIVDGLLCVVRSLIILFNLRCGLCSLTLIRGI